MGRRKMLPLCSCAWMLWQKRPWRWVLAIIIGAVLGIAVGQTVLASLGSLVVVEGTSMAPNYQPDARLYTVPITSALQRGDVVLVNDGSGSYALKRIVGLPGETIHLWRGYIFINRRLLHEPYLARHTWTFPDERVETYRFSLDLGQYFVLGDNRQCSVDSRRYGPVHESGIKSRIPLPEGFARPYTVHYTLPEEGKRTIRPWPQADGGRPLSRSETD